MWQCIHHPLIQESSEWHQHIHKTLRFVQKLIKMWPYRLRVLLMRRFPQIGLANVLYIEAMVQ